MLLLALGSAAAIGALCLNVGTLPDREPAMPAAGALSFVQPGSAPAPQASLSVPQLSGGELRVAKFIEHRYQIAIDAAEQLTTMAEDVGKSVGLDPMLLLAVMAIESRFNPLAESPGGAKGLMQIIPQYHRQRVIQLGAAAEDVLKPWINVLVGAQILREYVDRAGSIDAGLQWYNGTATDQTRSYAQRVLFERDRLLRELNAGRLARAPQPQS
jgi:soluble lytic murein transglycosylase-like protein